MWPSTSSAWKCLETPFQQTWFRKYTRSSVDGMGNDGKPSFPAVYHSPVGIHSETSEANISTRVWNLGTSYTPNTLWGSLSKEESGLGSDLHLKFVWSYVFRNWLSNSISLMKQEYPNLFHSLQEMRQCLSFGFCFPWFRGQHAPCSL